MKNSKKHFGVATIAALLMAGAMGLNINTIGVFLQPVAFSLGVSTGAISMHSTLLSIGMAFAAFLVPPVLDRFKFRLVVLIATITIAVATFGMAFSTQIWMFNILGFIRGFSAAFFGIVALQLLINNWFIAKHGLVTSLVFSFSGIAGALFSPILSSVIQNYGWQSAYMVQSLLFIVLNLPGILIPYEFHPENEGKLPYDYEDESTSTNKKTVVKNPRKAYSFKSITFGATITFSLLVSSLTAMSQHLAGIGLDFGFSATIGALMISACMVGNIVFKLVIGVISDVAGTILSILSMVGTVILGLVLLLIGSTNTVMLVGSLLIGAVYSVAAVGLSLLVRFLYSDMEFPKVFPMVNFISNIGGALAVSIYGYSYDLTGGYTLAIIASIVVMLINIGLVLLANRTSMAKI